MVGLFGGANATLAALKPEAVAVHRNENDLIVIVHLLKQPAQFEFYRESASFALRSIDYFRLTVVCFERWAQCSASQCVQFPRTGPATRLRNSRARTFHTQSVNLTTTP